MMYLIDTSPNPWVRKRDNSHCTIESTIDHSRIDIRECYGICVQYRSVPCLNQVQEEENVTVYAKTNHMSAKLILRYGRSYIATFGILY